MSPFVLDASVALSILFEVEFSPYADAVVAILRRERAVTPIVWPLEVANAIVNAVRRGRILEVDARLLVDAIQELQVDVDRETGSASLMQAAVTLGITHRLSAYDASYLELAMRRGLPIATNDQRLRSAALAAGIDILQP